MGLEKDISCPACGRTVEAVIEDGEETGSVDCDCGVRIEVNVDEDEPDEILYVDGFHDPDRGYITEGDGL